MQLQPSAAKCRVVCTVQGGDQQQLSSQPEKVQFVRVVNSSGKSRTVPVRAAGGPGLVERPVAILCRMVHHVSALPAN